jgi:hypothetical protein
MTTEELVCKLRTYNEWRRGGEDPQPSPKDIGEWIDEACEKLIGLEQQLEQTQKELQWQVLETFQHMKAER